ncbi:MAG: PAS domain-containing protein, partial [Actinobacteria bacterium]|nr:PAS domain-containing protein [Actinomycetota bacterium]
QSVSFAGERFLRGGQWAEAVDDVLASIGRASGASRAYLFEFRDEPGGRRGYETNEWCADGIEGSIQRPENQGYRVEDISSDVWEAMQAGVEFRQLSSEAEEATQKYMSAEGVLSALIVPVFVSGRLWGNLGLDDCAEERMWSAAEVGALRTAASTLGAAITREDVEAKLREGEAAHRTLVEAVPAVIYRADPDEGPVTYVSPQYKAMFGYTPEERLADPRLWMRLAHPDDLQMVIDASNLADRTGTPFSMEYRMYRRDGRLIWVSDESVLQRDEEGNPQSWLGIIIDITGRKAAEEELRRHDAILEAVGFAAAQFLHAESWEECVDDVLRHLGRSGDASRAYLFQNSVGHDGRTRTSITHEWTAEGISAEIDNPALKSNLVSEPTLALGEAPPWARTLAGGGYYQANAKDVRPEEQSLLVTQGIQSFLLVPIFVGAEWWGFLGYDECRSERTWSLAEVEALRAAAGLLGAVIQRTDIESQLREAEERNRLLIEQLPAVVYMDEVDDESSSIYISPQIETLLGYTAEQWITDPAVWIDAIHPDDREAVLAENRRTNATGDDFIVDYRAFAADGRLLWLHDEAVLMRDAVGKPRHWYGVISDITDRKESEVELARALKLEREAGERLRSLDEMKNTFLTAVSHDFRTPLAAVLGLALTLERGDIGLSEKESMDLAHRIATNARKLDRLVTDLLDLDRLSRGIFDPNLAPTDLGLLVRKVVSEADYLGDRQVIVEAQSVEMSV